MVLGKPGNDREHMLAYLDNVVATSILWAEYGRPMPFAQPPLHAVLATLDAYPDLTGYLRRYRQIGRKFGALLSTDTSARFALAVYDRARTLEDPFFTNFFASVRVGGGAIYWSSRRPVLFEDDLEQNGRHFARAYELAVHGRAVEL